MEELKENWIDEMIIREALPPVVRGETTLAFLEKWGVASSTYYSQLSKAENKEKIHQKIIDNAKKHAPEVLENLGERAKENSQDAKLYLQFVLQLAEKTDITSKGESINIIFDESFKKRE